MLNLISDNKTKEMDRKGMLRAVREKEVKDGQLPFKLRSDDCTVAQHLILISAELKKKIK